MSKLTVNQMKIALDKGLGSVFTKEDVFWVLDNLETTKPVVEEFNEQSLSLLAKEIESTYNVRAKEINTRDVEVDFSLDCYNTVQVNDVNLDAALDVIDIQDIVLEGFKNYKDKLTAAMEQEELMNEVEKLKV